MLCVYGCNQEARFLLRNGKVCCEKSSNSCPEIKRKNSEGIKKAYKNGNRKSIEFGGSKKRGDELRKKSKESLLKKPFEEKGRILQEEQIIQEQNFKCDHCGIQRLWNNLPLVFQLDHIDGNKKNNKRENLRLLCPNCHSQTPTWCGRGTNSGKIKIEDEILIEKLKEIKNIHKTLNYFGFSPTGGNYKRIYKLISKYSLESLFEITVIEKTKVIEKVIDVNEIMKNKNRKLIEENNKIRKELKNFKQVSRKFPMGHQLGEKNSQFGTCWIYNLDSKENKKIKKEEVENWLNLGWLIGRKLNLL